MYVYSYIDFDIVFKIIIIIHAIHCYIAMYVYLQSEITVKLMNGNMN